MDAIQIRKIILEQSKRAHVGHIGSCLSIVEIILALYSGVMHIPSPDDSERDRLVLSKGHAALTLYATLHLKGWIDEEMLNTFLGENSLLGVHPEHHVPGIDFSTGSLGQGLSMATGAALSAKLQKSTRRVFAVVSDAELNEGSTWEALMFAGHHKLNNLIVIVDLNAQQALDYTRNVIDLDSISEKWESFNWYVKTVDGHDVDALASAMANNSEKPLVIFADTTFGKGVSYMENKIKWHYWPMSDEEYEQAMRELKQTEAQI